MTGITFFFENNDTDVWSGRRVDLDAWNYACKAAGDIDSVIIINKTAMEIKHFDVKMNTHIVSTWEEAEEIMSGDRQTFITCPWDGGSHSPLYDFDHKTDWYVFGPASGWKVPRDGIYIPQAGRGSLHSMHIASAVLLHRFWRLH
jgi:hypothetical protein